MDEPTWWELAERFWAWFNSDKRWFNDPYRNPILKPAPPKPLGKIPNLDLRHASF